MRKDYLERVREPGQEVNPLFSFLGVKVELISAEKVVLRLPFKRDFLQGGGVIAGGIMAALADEAMAHLVIAHLAEDETTATLEMNLRFLRPLSDGEITAEASLLKKGRQVITLACSVTGPQGQLLAQAGATFIAIKLPQASRPPLSSS